MLFQDKSNDRRVSVGVDKEGEKKDDEKEGKKSPLPKHNNDNISFFSLRIFSCRSLPPPFIYIYIFRKGPFRTFHMGNTDGGADVFQRELLP